MTRSRPELFVILFIVLSFAMPVSFQVFDLATIANTPPSHSDTSSPRSVLRASVTLTPPDFEPKGGPDTNELTVSVVLSRPGIITFELFNVSHEPGYCLNAPIDPNGSSSSADLQFPAQDDFRITGLEHERATTTSPRATASVKVRSLDYGAYGMLRASLLDAAGTPSDVILANGSPYLTISGDLKKYNIADWLSCDAPHRSCASMDDDDSEPPGNGQQGDRLTRYEEYRGVMTKAGHVRLRPTNKDVFYSVDDALADNLADWAQSLPSANLHELSASQYDEQWLITPNSKTCKGEGARVIVIQANVLGGEARGRPFGETGCLPPRNSWDPCFPRELVMCYVYTDDERYGIAGGDVLVDPLQKGDTQLLARRKGKVTWARAGRIRVEDETMSYRGVDELKGADGSERVRLRNLFRTSPDYHPADVIVGYFAEPSKYIAWVVAHEGGHAVGLLHDEHAYSLMTELKAGESRDDKKYHLFRPPRLEPAGSLAGFSLGGPGRTSFIPQRVRPRL